MTLNSARRMWCGAFGALGNCQTPRQPKRPRPLANLMQDGVPGGVLGPVAHRRGRSCLHERWPWGGACVGSLGSDRRRRFHVYRAYPHSGRWAAAASARRPRTRLRRIAPVAPILLQLRALRGPIRQQPLARPPRVLTSGLFSRPPLSSTLRMPTTESSAMIVPGPAAQRRTRLHGLDPSTHPRPGQVHSPGRPSALADAAQRHGDTHAVPLGGHSPLRDEARAVCTSMLTEGRPGPGLAWPNFGQLRSKSRKRFARSGVESIGQNPTGLHKHRTDIDQLGSESIKLVP